MAVMQKNLKTPGCWLIAPKEDQRNLPSIPTLNCFPLRWPANRTNLALSELRETKPFNPTASQRYLKKGVGEGVPRAQSWANFKVL